MTGVEALVDVRKIDVTVVVMSVEKPIHGLGAAKNPMNRFEQIVYERDAKWDEPDDPSPKTRFFRDASSSIITYNDSPDVGFEASINPYRGREHGCLCYCIMRPINRPVAAG